MVINCPKCGHHWYEDEPELDKQACAVEYIRTQWNAIAGYAGFAKVQVMSAARKRQVNAAIKDHGSKIETWLGAIQRYVKSAERWPERKKFGFDTFIRASKRDQWFEEAVPEERKPMTEQEAVDHYTRDLK